MAINGTQDDDVLVGDDNNNTIIGKGGDDKIIGNDGDDTIKGGQGDDNISSGAGDDSIEAGANDDTIRGGKGADEMEGGNGSDTFVFFAGADFRTDTDDDVVMDFELGVDLVNIKSPDSYNFAMTSVGDDLVIEVGTQNGVDRGSITFIGLGDEFADDAEMTGAELMALLNDWGVV